MNILIADDDAVTLRLLAETVSSLGHRVVTATDGGAALACLEGPDPPGLALLDWVMPKLNGPEICRALRSGSERMPDTYLILVTARAAKADIVAGLRAGANDYVIKPFNAEELAARIDIGIRISCLERRMRSKVREAEALQARLDAVEKLLPCPSCRTLPASEGYWLDLDAFHRAAGSAHRRCPGCVPVGCSR